MWLERICSSSLSQRTLDSMPASPRERLCTKHSRSCVTEHRVWEPTLVILMFMACVFRQRLPRFKDNQTKERILKVWELVSHQRCLPTGQSTMKSTSGRVSNVRFEIIRIHIRAFVQGCHCSSRVRAKFTYTNSIIQRMQHLRYHPQPKCVKMIQRLHPEATVSLVSIRRSLFRSLGSQVCFFSRVDPSERIDEGSGSSHRIDEGWLEYSSAITAAIWT